MTIVCGINDSAPGKHPNQAMLPDNLSSTPLPVPTDAVRGGAASAPPARGAATGPDAAPGPGKTAKLPHVLVADDDAAWRTALCRYLRGNGFDSTEFADFAALTDSVASRAGIFVVVTELTVGSRHLFDCLSGLAQQPAAAVVVLSDQNDDTETIVALEIGADDVIRKGTDRREILARIRAAARRLQVRQSLLRQPAGVPESRKDQMQAAWRFRPDKRELADPEGRPVLLTTLEFKMLEALVANTGRPLRRRDLCVAVLGRPYEASDRGIDNLVAKLRRKLGDPAKGARMIKTARPLGYVFTGFNGPSSDAETGNS